MKALFLHATLNGLSAEYKVHVTLATNTRSNNFTPYFIWQSPLEFKPTNDIHIIPHDFGRDISISPRPGRYRRASMMMQRLPKALVFLITKIKQINPDVLYTSQQSFDIGLASLLANLFHIPHIIHIHYSVGPWLGRRTLNIIKKSSRLIAVSEYTRQTALLQGVSPSSIHTLVNPTPFSQSQPQQDDRSIRAEFQLENDTPLVVAVGRLDPGKGHLALFEAFAQVVQHLPHARLLVCGTSNTRDNYEITLQQRVNELQIDKHTIFAGHRNDIPAILWSSNVFCLPTELDPCPLVFLEAMAAGLPVVAFYSGGVPEMVLHNQTGLLSYPGDIQALATNLRKVLVDTSYAQRLGESGKKRVETEFTPAIIADRWLKLLYEKIK